MWVTKQPFFLSCSSDRSGPCFSVQCSPTSLRAVITVGRRLAGPQQEAHPGQRERACKVSIGLSSIATECQAMTVTMWHNSYLCPLILLSPCSWHLDGLTLIAQIEISGGGGESCTRQWAIFDWKLKDKFTFDLYTTWPQFLTFLPALKPTVVPNAL